MPHFRKERHLSRQTAWPVQLPTFRAEEVGCAGLNKQFPNLINDTVFGRGSQTGGWVEEAIALSDLCGGRSHTLKRVVGGPLNLISCIVHRRNNRVWKSGVIRVFHSRSLEGHAGTYSKGITECFEENKRKTIFRLFIPLFNGSCRVFCSSGVENSRPGFKMSSRIQCTPCGSRCAG